VKVNYQAVGSGAGINQITNGTVDFGASDAIMTNIQQSQAEAAYGPLLHIPTTLGAVTVIYIYRESVIAAQAKRGSAGQIFA